MTESVVADFIKGLSRHAARLEVAQQSIAFECLMRLGFATGTRDLRGMRLAAPDTSLDGLVIVSGTARAVHKLSRAERRKIYHEPPPTPKPPNILQIVDELHGNTIVGSRAMSDLRNNDGGDIRPTAEELRRPWIASDSAGTAVTRVEALVAPADSPYALNYAHPDVPTAPEVKATTGALRAAGKVLPPIVAALEWVNLFKAAGGLRQKKSTEKKIEGGISTLAALLASLYATIDATEKLTSEDVAARLFSEELVKATWKVKGFEIRLLDAFGAGVVLINGLMEGWEAIDLFSDGETGAGVFQALASLSDIALSAVLVGKALKRRVSAATGETIIETGTEEAAVETAGGVALEEAGGEALAGTVAAEAGLAWLGPLGVALMVVSIVATIASELLKDTPYEHWAGHGPFAKDADDRLTDEYKGKSWRELYAGLAGLLLRPRVTLRRDPSRGYTGKGAPAKGWDRGYWRPDVIVEVVAPGWRPGESVLDIQATRERMMTYSESVSVGALAQGAAYSSANRAMMNQLEPGQKPVPPYLCEWLYDDAKENVIGLRYRYRGPDDREHRYRWYARAHLVTPDMVIIPPLPEKGEKQPDAERIDPDIKGWAYAEPLTVSP